MTLAPFLLLLATVSLETVDAPAVVTPAVATPAPAPASPAAAPSERIAQQACAAAGALAGVALGDVAVLAAGAGVIAGMWVLDQSQSTAFRGALVIAAALLAMPIAGPLGAAVVVTVMNEGRRVAWQPAAFGIGGAVVGALLGFGFATGIAQRSPTPDAALVALGGAFVGSTVAAVAVAGAAAPE